MEVGEIAKLPSFKWELNIDCLNGKKVGETLVSRKFFSKNPGIPRNKWLLELYPKSELDEGWLALYLKNFSDKEVNASFSLSLLNQANVKVDNTTTMTQDTVFKPMSGWGFSKFVQENFVRDPKNNVLKNNKIVITCTIIIKNKSVIYKALESAQYHTRLKFLDDYEKVLTNEEFSDVTITAEGKNFYLHKCILTARSPVFEVMFRSNMKEKNENLLEIKDIRYKVLQEFFQFIYTGKVGNTEEIICELLTAAEKYCIEELKALCEEKMSNNVTQENAIKYLNSAIMNGAKKLEIAIVKFICLNLEIFLENTEFDKLGMEHPQVLLKILRDLV